MSRFGYEIPVFLIHNRAVFRTATGTASSYVTGTVSWKNIIFLMFIVAENTGSVNISLTTNRIGYLVGWLPHAAISPSVFYVVTSVLLQLFLYYKKYAIMTI